jgi:hypothetical protein
MSSVNQRYKTGSQWAQVVLSAATSGQQTAYLLDMHIASTPAGFPLAVKLMLHSSICIRQ